ncbi:hypothetical protein KR018_009010 [Drosophila ironensis]|nr:hypothetical protein KR018_009010 [Drosophila ironensis]
MANHNHRRISPNVRRLPLIRASDLIPTVRATSDSDSEAERLRDREVVQRSVAEALNFGSRYRMEDETGAGRETDQPASRIVSTSRWNVSHNDESASSSSHGDSHSIVSLVDGLLSRSRPRPLDLRSTSDSDDSEAERLRDRAMLQRTVAEALNLDPREFMGNYRMEDQPGAGRETNEAAPRLVPQTRWNVWRNNETALITRRRGDPHSVQSLVDTLMSLPLALRASLDRDAEVERLRGRALMQRTVAEALHLDPREFMDNYRMEDQPGAGRETNEAAPRLVPQTRWNVGRNNEAALFTRRGDPRRNAPGYHDEDSDEYETDNNSFWANSPRTRYYGNVSTDSEEAEMDNISTLVFGSDDNGSDAENNAAGPINRPFGRPYRYASESDDTDSDMHDGNHFGVPKRYRGPGQGTPRHSQNQSSGNRLRKRCADLKEGCQKLVKLLGTVSGVLSDIHADIDEYLENSKRGHSSQSKIHKQEIAQANRAINSLGFGHASDQVKAINRVQVEGLRRRRALRPRSSVLPTARN